MSVEQLGMIAGVILSLAVRYVPQIAQWYDGFDSAGKARVMGGLLVVAAVGVFGAGCFGLGALVPCTTAGALDLLGVLIAALMANQAAFLIAVKPFKKTA